MEKSFILLLIFTLTTIHFSFGQNLRKRELLKYNSYALVCESLVLKYNDLVRDYNKLLEFYRESKREVFCWKKLCDSLTGVISNLLSNSDNFNGTINRSETNLSNSINEIERNFQFIKNASNVYVYTPFNSERVGLIAYILEKPREGDFYPEDYVNDNFISKLELSKSCKTFKNEYKSEKNAILVDNYYVNGIIQGSENNPKYYIDRENIIQKKTSPVFLNIYFPFSISKGDFENLKELGFKTLTTTRVGWGANLNILLTNADWLYLSLDFSSLNPNNWFGIISNKKFPLYFSGSLGLKFVKPWFGFGISHFWGGYGTIYYKGGKGDIDIYINDIYYINLASLISYDLNNNQKVLPLFRFGFGVRLNFDNLKNVYFF
ncbi:MAG: hypothetical protein N2517_08215 [Ignavibacteria bacterium]|nr:hypothetical protein [Ignavibacteria bacterium]